MRMFQFAKDDWCLRTGILTNNINFELPNRTIKKQVLLKQCPKRA